MFKKWIVAAALLVSCASASHAAVIATGAGPRVGFSVSPDQLVFGGHVVIGEVAPKITFDPSLELGIGSDLTTVAVNFDLHYHFLLSDSEWRPYIGAGVAVMFVERDLPAPLRDDSNTGVGGSLILGAGVPTKAGNRFFGELKFGLGDEIPDLKLMVGWNFRL